MQSIEDIIIYANNERMENTENFSIDTGKWQIFFEIYAKNRLDNS